MAVKDVFDIADHYTGNGHPLWLKSYGIHGFCLALAIA
jgi:hypothetical protein